MGWKDECKRSVSCADYENVLQSRGGFFLISPRRMVIKLLKAARGAGVVQPPLAMASGARRVIKGGVRRPRAQKAISKRRV